jgi:hypothetical protein
VLELEIHRFEGTDPDFVLVIGGLHTSEQSGIEVARWVAVKLAARKTPTRLGAIVIPEIFPQRAVAARTDEFSKTSRGDWRDDDPGTRGFYKGYSKVSFKKQIIYPNRQFPPPGKPLSFLSKGFLKEADGSDLQDGGKQIPLQPEIAYLIRIIEECKPVRIVSCHGKVRREPKHLTAAVQANRILMTPKEITDWAKLSIAKQPIKGVNFAGVYVDPRYTPASTLNATTTRDPSKFNLVLEPAYPLKGDPTKKRFDSAISPEGKKDDALCLALATVVNDPVLVGGNHIAEPVAVVHYADEGAPDGYSLGDWGPVEVLPNQESGVGKRPGAPVFTIEADEDHESWAFADGVQLVTEDGNPLPRPPTPAERKTRKKPQPPQAPQFDAARSKSLQAYANGIIKTILELP